MENLDVLIAGQVLTSRTETIERYFKDRVRYLGVLGISNPYSVKGCARASLYFKGGLIKKFSVFSAQLKGIYWLNQLLMGPVFLLYGLSMFNSVLKFKKKFDVFIGIACFSALFGIFLKKIGIVKNVVYYTLDYYPLPLKFHVNTLINKAIWYLDRYCCRNSCLVWNISPSILTAREKFVNLWRGEYNHVLAPLTYDKSFLRFIPYEEIEKDTLVFIGTLSRNQGLQLIVESLPELVKFKPDLKVKVIGKGPDGEAIKMMVRERGLDDRFVFYGFLEKEEDVLDIISRCAVGICTWTDDADNNVIYADPGKPKLYAFCGVPIIITRVTAVAEEIDRYRAGLAINYNKKEFIEAVLKILENKDEFEQYRKNSRNFAEKYTSDIVYGNALKETLSYV